MTRATAILAACLVLAGVSDSFAAETLHFVIMAPAEPEKEALKYEALSVYLSSVNPLLGDIKLRIAKNYPEAARLFASGDVEGMFSGSFVAAVFIAKGIARPVARPLGTNGSSTYSTAVVARKGTARFTGIADFKGKRVAFCSLASAGDVFARSLLEPGETYESVFTPVPVDSHLAALKAVLGGAADFAVVKSTVFTPGEFPELIEVGSDPGEHPDSTLIMPIGRHELLGALISRALLGLEGDTGEKAQAAKRAFGCSAFIKTAGGDFAPTFKLLRKARIDPKTFNFDF